ncbi:MAG: retropepsin-like aspartic protease [Candidatus Binatia bacterium]
MLRHLAGAVVIVGALLLDPIADGPHAGRDLDAVRLDRLSAVEEPGRSPRSLANGIEGTHHDIPLSGDRKHLIVDGTLNGIVTGPMLIDTGASYCVLTHQTARKLGIAPRKHRTIPVATANGQVDADLVALDALQIRDARLAGVDAVIMDAVEPPLIGIIGLNFLTQFRFSVDLAAGTLRLEP